MAAKRSTRSAFRDISNKITELPTTSTSSSQATKLVKKPLPAKITNRSANPKKAEGDEDTLFVQVKNDRKEKLFPAAVNSTTGHIEFTSPNRKKPTTFDPNLHILVRPSVDDDVDHDADDERERVAVVEPLKRKLLTKNFPVTPVSGKKLKKQTKNRKEGITTATEEDYDVKRQRRTRGPTHQKTYRDGTLSSDDDDYSEKKEQKNNLDTDTKFNKNAAKKAPSQSHGEVISGSGSSNEDEYDKTSLTSSPRRSNRLHSPKSVPPSVERKRITLALLDDYLDTSSDWRSVGAIDY